MAIQPRLPKSQSLLELPLEIRLRIYEFIFTFSEIYVLLINANPEDRYVHIHGSDIGLLLTCRQIYHEARSEWYTANLWTIGFPPALGLFLRSSSPEALARVKHLTVQIHELPDLNTKRLPGLKMLVIDFSNSLPSFMAGDWFYLDDEKIYSHFADEAIARVHNTFKVLITEMHEKDRPFNVGLFASTVRGAYNDEDHRYYPTRSELFVDLDTKVVRRHTPNQSKIDEQRTCPEEKLVGETGEASDSECSPERSQHIRTRRHKFPPGREGPFGDEEKDERGSTRSSEREDASDDSDDEEEDEEAKRLREAAAKTVDWEHVKRIIEHPSDDEQSASGTESEGEGEAEENKVSESNGLDAEAEHRTEDHPITISGNESEAESESKDEETISASRHLKAEVDRQISHLILGASTASPEPEQAQPPSPRLACLPLSEEQPTPAVIPLPVPATVAQTEVHVTGNSYSPVEERVIYTTKWSEPEPSVLLSAVDLRSAKSGAVSQTTEL